MLRNIKFYHNNCKIRCCSSDDMEKLSNGFIMFDDMGENIKIPAAGSLYSN